MMGKKINGLLFSLKFILPVIIMVIFSSCTRIKVTSQAPAQTGLASWYGPDFHGRATSSREIYDMYDLTAAHKTLPFGTMVVVTNLENGKSVTVRINDRGPFVKGRIIDLSYAAAKAIDMVGPGVVPVKLEILEKSAFPSSLRKPKYFVQVGAFIKKENAVLLRNELRKQYPKVRISEFSTRENLYYRVRIPSSSRKEAENISSRLLDSGYTPIIFEE